MHSIKFSELNNPLSENGEGINPLGEGQQLGKDEPIKGASVEGAPSDFVGEKAIPSAGTRPTLNAKAERERLLAAARKKHFEKNLAWKACIDQVLQEEREAVARMNVAEAQELEAFLLAAGEAAVDTVDVVRSPDHVTEGEGYNTLVSPTAPQPQPIPRDFVQNVDAAIDSVNTLKNLIQQNQGSSTPQTQANVQQSLTHATQQLAAAKALVAPGQTTWSPQAATTVHGHLQTAQNATVAAAFTAAASGQWNPAIGQAFNQAIGQAHQLQQSMPVGPAVPTSLFNNPFNLMPPPPTPFSSQQQQPPRVEDLFEIFNSASKEEQNSFLEAFGDVPGFDKNFVQNAEGGMLQAMYGNNFVPGAQDMAYRR